MIVDMKINTKAIPVFLAGSLLTLGSAMAQIESETVTAQKVKKEEVPTTVVASVEEDFPDKTVEDFALIPAKVYQEDWVVSKSEQGVTDESTFDPQYYQVEFSGKGESGKAVYNSAGELIHSKEIIKDESLPEAITKKIADQYPDYQITKDKEVIKDGNKKVDYYQVEIKKGKDKEKLYFSENGEMLKGKKDADTGSWLLPSFYIKFGIV